MSTDYQTIKRLSKFLGTGEFVFLNCYLWPRLYFPIPASGGARRGNSKNLNGNRNQLRYFLKGFIRKYFLIFYCHYYYDIY
jgi:hypothetical protein